MPYRNSNFASPPPSAPLRPSHRGRWKLFPPSSPVPPPAGHGGDTGREGGRTCNLHLILSSPPPPPPRAYAAIPSPPPCPSIHARPRRQCTNIELSKRNERKKSFTTPFSPSVAPKRVFRRRYNQFSLFFLYRALFCGRSLNLNTWHRFAFF